MIRFLYRKSNTGFEFFCQIRERMLSNTRQMSVGTCQISAGSSNPDDKFGFNLAIVYTLRFAKSSLG
jgi:hypothetical protein